MSNINRRIRRKQLKHNQKKIKKGSETYKVKYKEQDGITTWDDLGVFSLTLKKQLLDIKLKLDEIKTLVNRELGDDEDINNILTGIYGTLGDILNKVHATSLKHGELTKKEHNGKEIEVVIYRRGEIDTSNDQDVSTFSEVLSDYIDLSNLISNLTMVSISSLMTEIEKKLTAKANGNETIDVEVEEDTDKKDNESKGDENGTTESEQPTDDTGSGSSSD